MHTRPFDHSRKDDVARLLNRVMRGAREDNRETRERWGAATTLNNNKEMMGAAGEEEP